MWLAVAVWDPVLHLKLLLGGMDLGQELDEIKKNHFSHCFICSGDLLQRAWQACGSSIISSFLETVLACQKWQILIFCNHGL